MNDRMTRLGLYAERFLAALTIGLFLILPLYFKSLGWNEVVFGQIYLIGIVGTICSILSGIKFMHKVGFRKIAPIGNLLCAISCLLYLAGTISQSISCYYLASLLQGAGWGLSFTTGPIGIISTVPEKDNAKRVHFLTIHTALTSIGFCASGFCASAFIIRFYVNLNWTMQHLCILTIVCSTISYIISAIVAKRSIAYENIKVDRLSGLQEFFAILKTPSAYFLLLIFLNAFIYMAVISLQTTFAALKKIDYIIFFGCWWLALIVPRLTLSKIISKISPYLCISIFTFLMIVGAWLLLWVEHASIWYALSALMLGTGYGLAYVFEKTEAIHYVAPSLRPSVLIYFGLAYFLGVYLGTFCAALIAGYISYTALWLTLVGIGFVCYFIVIYFYQIAYKNIHKNL